MSQFSTNEAVSLEKCIVNIENITKSSIENFDEKYQIKKCINWVKEHGFQKVCLQFPNKFLPDAVNVVTKLENELKNKLFLLADTTYESCCVDYVAAKHINADAIIHFGENCNSRLLENAVPVLQISEYLNINLDNFCREVNDFSSQFNEQLTCLVFSKNYCTLQESVKDCLRNSKLCEKIKIIHLNSYSKNEAENYITLFIGEENRDIANFQNFFQVKNLYICDPVQKQIEINRFTGNSRAYKRRFYLVESIKDAKTIGIVVGTLAVNNYLKILNRIRKLCKLHNKKCYTLSVGKPNVAKLANFPEMDVFVVIACPVNEIYDSRDYYKPIVTPYDLESALNPNCSAPIYNPYDYNEINLDEEISRKVDVDVVDVSLLTGKLRSNNLNDTERIEESSLDVVIRNDMKIVENNHHGAGFLASRSWKGLEQNLGETSPELAKVGRTGLAKGYKNELS